MPAKVTKLRKMTRPAVPTDAKTVVLGEKYTDTVTGIKGVATVVYVHLTGCDQVCLDYVNDGKQTYLVVDATRLHEITPAANPRAGGPGLPPPSRLPS